jgi:hypothetical protein
LGPPTAADQSRGRCGEVSDAEANSMLALFKRVGALSVSEDGHAWLFTVRAAMPYDVVFFLNPVRPDWSSCGFAGVADETPPASTSSGLGDPCKDLPTAAARAIMGDGLMRADTQVAEPASAGRGLIDGASCGYSVHQDAPIFDAVTIAIYARDDVGDAEAGALAASILGDETPEAIGGGWSLYANGCTGPAPVCPPSLILARAPLLYLIDTPTRFRDDDARRIAAAIATGVDARPSAAPGSD